MFEATFGLYTVANFAGRIDIMNHNALSPISTSVDAAAKNGNK
jgi:hypothetical protein